MKNNWPKSPIKWIKNRTLYISIPFTWHLPKIKSELRIQSNLYYDKIILGGPAVYLMPNYFNKFKNIKIKKHYEGILQKINPLATRTTTGCIRNCKFCGVRSFEGEFKELKDWPDLPLICDNNLLASSQRHFDKVIDRLIKWKWCDFNQGLDMRLLTNYHAKRFNEIKKPIIRLALDNKNNFDKWMIAYDKLRKAGMAKSKIRTYALIGFDSDPSEAWDRCNKLDNKGIVLPMWFHPLNSLKQNQVTKEQKELGWNDFERRKIMSWFYWHRETKK